MGAPEPSPLASGARVAILFAVAFLVGGVTCLSINLGKSDGSPPIQNLPEGGPLLASFPTDLASSAHTFSESFIDSRFSWGRTDELLSSPTVSTIEVGSEPTQAAYDPQNGYIYVPNYGASASSPWLYGNLSIINGTRVAKSLVVGSYPLSATYDARDGYVYVSNSESDNLSLVSNTNVIGAVLIGGDPALPGYDGGNGYLYVPNSAENVTVISGFRPIASVNDNTGPDSAAYDSSNGYVYVADAGAGTVDIINGTKLIGSLNVGLIPDDPTFDGTNGYVYVPHYYSNYVSVILGTKVVGSVVVGDSPLLISIDESNGFAYVTNYGSDNVTVLNGTSVIRSIEVGNGPYDAEYDSGNGLVYVTNCGSDNVSVLNATRVLQSVNVGSCPELEIYDPANYEMYVMNYNSSNVSAIYTRAYSSVTFGETGLPLGTNWSVTLNGTKNSSTSSSVGFAELDQASYSYAIGNVPGYTANFTVGIVTVNYTAVRVPVSFNQTPYGVTFLESGLVSGTTWSVTLGGGWESSSSDVLAFSEFDGTYPFTVGQVNGYTEAPQSGNVTVDNAYSTVHLTFTPVTFPVTFTEAGLAPGTRWSVNLSGRAEFSTTPSIAFAEPNGSYAYTTGPVEAYMAKPSSGTFTLNGSGESFSVIFTPFTATFGVLFAEVGLPAGIAWWVNLTGGPPMASNSSLLSFSEPNGSYAFAVATGDKTYDSNGGAFSVNGSETFVNLTFSKVTYSVSFEEQGLPASTGWAVSFNGIVKSGTGLLPFTDLTNGSYSFSVEPISGYNGTPSRGTITVAGSAVIQSISFRSTGVPLAKGVGAPRLLGLPVTEGYAVLGGIIAATVAAGVLLMALVERRRRPPRSS